MKKKISLFIVMLVTIALILIFSNIYIKGNVKPVVYIIVKVVNADYDFWESCRMGAETAAKEYNVELVFTGPNLQENVNKQIELIKNAIKQNPSAIIVAASNHKELKETAEQVVKNKIHLITLDSEIESQPEECYVGTDNILAGKEIAEKLASTIDEEGKIAVVSFVKESSTAIDREKGIELALKKYKNIKVITTEYCNGSSKESYEITKKLLRDNKDLKGIIGTNQQSLEGIALAVEELKVQYTVAVMGFDTSNKLVKALENDIVDAFLVQKPYNMGYISVKSAVDAINNKKVDKRVNIDFEIVYKDTIYEKENEKLVFPFIE
ncbi:substrate-binding domain-containing protein [Clostridium grantii]|uniref:Ribose transport system substrate-binding protein n=1 Tax=Clostridium grantii DSM 8605 TaxID=1121316 RepID=A0A1M5WTZ1_9CLOT|nr:substrate-binding domain-containing protein [Clostridium grantii]SHH91115.1 ribose transport system substrate-binding protein [Clostridium grantii DSM 8605]